jgi:hypothetical protein
MFPKTFALFEAMIGTTSEDTNKHIFTHLLPPFPPNSLIHHNGCGSGQVTSEIMATNSPSSIRIIATDANKYVLTSYLPKMPPDLSTIGISFLSETATEYDLK